MAANEASAASHVVVRKGNDSDIPLLHAGFASHYGQKRSFYGYAVPSAIVIQKLDILVYSPRWQFLVACPNHLPDEIMGMLISRISPDKDGRMAAAWLMTQWRYQQKGVAKALLQVAKIQPGEVDCAFIIPEFAKEVKPLGYQLRFRPYLPEVELYIQLQEEAKK